MRGAGEPGDSRSESCRRGSEAEERSQRGTEAREPEAGTEARRPEIGSEAAWRVRRLTPLLEAKIRQRAEERRARQQGRGNPRARRLKDGAKPRRRRDCKHEIAWRLRDEGHSGSAPDGGSQAC